jgi:hypothetical protein
MPPVAPPTIVEFKAIEVGISPTVRVSHGGVTYEKGYANWLTWTVVIFTVGQALCAWPWILFDRRTVTIPRGLIQGVETHGGGSRTTLIVRWTTDTVEFKTDVATAETARNILLSAN